PDVSTAASWTSDRRKSAAMSSVSLQPPTESSRCCAACVRRKPTCWTASTGRLRICRPASPRSKRSEARRCIWPGVTATSSASKSSRRCCRRPRPETTESMATSIRPPSGIRLGELIEAEVSGLQIFLDTVRYESESNQVWLLSMSGQSTAVRGAWANLTGFHSYLKLLPSELLLTLAGGGLGWRSRSARVGDPKRLGRSWEHIVLLPPCTETWGHIGEMLVVERQDRQPAATLMNLLAIRSSLPLDSEWNEEVWQWAVETS